MSDEENQSLNAWIDEAGDFPPQICPECNGRGRSFDGLRECEYCEGMGVFEC